MGTDHGQPGITRARVTRVDPFRITAHIMKSSDAGLGELSLLLID